MLQWLVFQIVQQHVLSSKPNKTLKKWRREKAGDQTKKTQPTLPGFFFLSALFEAILQNT